jgi:hypothetical protein
MNKQDAEALPWMAQFQRDPWPKKVVWQQDDISHRRFYWLQIPDGTPIKDRQKIVATVEGQAIRLEGDPTTTIRLRLSDQLLDLDQAVTVVSNGHEIFVGKVPRLASAILTSLTERADIPAAATALPDRSPPNTR